MFRAAFQLKVKRKLTFGITLAGMKRKMTKQASQRRKPVQSRAKVTVEAMLDAAIVILRAGGIAAITTNRIAETAGVSIGSVYQYFPNKHALFLALHERHIRQVDEVMRRHLERPNADTLDQLIGEMLDGMIEAHRTDSTLSKLLQSEVPHRAGESVDFVTRLFSDFRAALSKYDRTSGLKSPPSGRAFLVATMVEAFSHAILLRRPRGVSLRSAKQECRQAIMAYLCS
jgi:AcrR family transcriptional regulator